MNVSSLLRGDLWGIQALCSDHTVQVVMGDLQWRTVNGRRQSWKMSNLLHGPISTNQILPGEKRVNRDILAPQTYKTELIGFLVMNKLSIYGSLSIDLNFFCTYLPKNGLFLLIILASQTFYPNWPIFLHGYIRHIRDIFQLCSSDNNSSDNLRSSSAKAFQRDIIFELLL